MIFIDIDGVLVDFCGTAKKFGVELEPNEFGKWKWGEPPYPAPEEFYAKAYFQPWAKNLLRELSKELHPILITKDFARIKQEFFFRNIDNSEILSEIYEDSKFFQAPGKSVHCKCPIDFLIDDNASECEAWRRKGGVAWHFDLASATPFEDFIEWWGMEK